MKPSSSWKYFLLAATSVSMTSTYATDTNYTIQAGNSMPGSLVLDVSGDPVDSGHQGVSYIIGPLSTGGKVLTAMAATTESLTVSSPIYPASIQFNTSNDSTVAVPIILSNEASILHLAPASGKTLALTGPITSSQATISVDGPGTVSLSGANTGLASLISVTAGTLNIFSDMRANIDLKNTATQMTITSSLSNPAATIKNGSAIQLNSVSGINTIAAQISDGSQGTIGTLIINAANQTGTVKLSGANTFTGQTSVIAGSLHVLSPTPLAGPIFVANGATLQLENSANVTYSGVMSGVGTIISKAPYKITLAGTPMFTGSLSASGPGGALQLGDSWIAAQPGLAIDVNPGGANPTIVEMNLTTGSAPSPTVYSGNFTQTSGSGGFTKLGSGWLELTGTNNITGPMTVSNGGLVLNGDVNLYLGNITVNNGSELHIKTSSGPAKNYSQTISGPGNVTIKNGGAISLTGSYILAGSTTLNDTNTSLTVLETTIPTNLVLSLSSNNTTFNINNSDTEHSGRISGLGSLTKSGARKLTLVGSNSYTGGSNITGGTLEVQTYLTGNYNNQGAMIVNMPSLNVNSSSIISGSGSVTKLGVYSWSIGAPQTYAGSTTINQGTIYFGVNNALSSLTDVMINATDNGTLSLLSFDGTTSYNSTTRTISGAGTLALGTGTLTTGFDVDQEFSGQITGSGNLVKQGNGVWKISGNNGANITATTIRDGVIQLGHPQSLGGSAVSLTSHTAVLDANGFTVANPITGLTGTIANTSANEAVIFSSIPITGPSVLSAYSGNLTANGAISGTNTLSITGANGKTVTTNGSLAVNGDITVTMAKACHNAKLVAFDGRKYTVTSGTATLPSTGIMSLAGSTFYIETNPITLTGSTVQIDPSNIGPRSTIATSGVGSIVIDSSNTVTTQAPYARTIEFSLPLTGSGNINKTDHGTLKISGSTTHSGSTTINGGRLIFTDTSAASSSQTITLAHFSDFEISGSGTISVARPVTGAGHFTKSGLGSLTLSGAMSYTGNTLVTGGSLFFTGSVTLGPNALINVGASSALTYKNQVAPVGTQFNPILGSGATLTMDGASIVTTSLMGNDLVIGSSSCPITIASGGLILNAGKPVVLQSPILGNGSLTKQGASTLILNNIGLSYTGSITVSAGTLLLDDSYANTSNISIGSSSTLIMNLFNPKQSTKTISGVTDATFIKRGPGTLTFDGNSGSINQFQGNLSIENGRIQLVNTGLHSNSVVNVSSQASLDVLSYGSGNSVYALNQVNLKSGGALRIIREHAPGAGNFNQTVINSLTGLSGSVLVIQFDPSTGSTSAPSSNTAPLKITTLTTGTSNTERVFLQVRPTTKQAMTSGNIYALIQGNNAGTTPVNMAGMLRLMPSIMFSSAYTLFDDPNASSSLMYGNLFYDGSALYMKVGTQGYYSQAVSGGPSASLPSSAYLRTFLGDLITNQNIPWYSALDQFLTAQNIHGTADWTMLSPLSQVQMNTAFYAHSQHTQEIFASQGLQKNMQSIMKKQNLSSSARQALNEQSTQHHNLKTDSKVSQKSQWKGWSNTFEIAGLSTDHNYHSELIGETTGISWDLSKGHILGYQFSNLEQNYKAFNGTAEGSMKSRVAQGNSYTILGNIQIETNVIAAKHDLSHDRIIHVGIDEYEKDWVAESKHGARELRIEQVAMRDQALNSFINISAGARYQSQYVSHEGYCEKGSEDLNLIVKPYETLNYGFQPLLGLSYHQSDESSWLYVRATTGYQNGFSSQSNVIFGFQDYEGEITLSASQPVKEAYTLGLDAVLGSLNGLSLMTSSKLAYHTDKTPSEYQGNMSLIWAF